MNVAVLGGSGMLGSMVVDRLSRERSFAVTATVRTSKQLHELRERCAGVRWGLLQVDSCSLHDVSDVIHDCEWVINCIGVIKPYIHDDRPAETERAVVVNALFPHLLARAAEQTN